MKQKTKYLKNLWRQFLSLDRYLDQKVPFLVLILLTIFLKIPTFFEPHHQIDESLYLTIGQGIRQNLDLYKDIFDHKPPLIYWLAFLSPNLMVFKFYGLIFSLISLWCFFKLSVKFFKINFIAIFSTLLFIILSFTPIFEGNTVNSELIFTTFNLLALCLFFTSKTLNSQRCYLIGLFFSLALLTKIPGLSDLITLLIFIAFIYKQKNKKTNVKFIILGLICPLIATVFYFFIQGSLSSFWQSAFLYNKLYLSYDTLKLSGILAIIFSLPFKFIINITLTGLIIYFFKRKSLSSNQTFIFLLLNNQGFFAFLSNRDYRHYFLQLIPGLCLVITVFFISLWKEKNKKILLKNVIVILTFIFLIIFNLTIKTIKPFKNIKYWGLDYYQNFINLITKKITTLQYAKNFNYLIEDNYYLANFFFGKENKTFYLWGDDPALFTTIKKIPTDKYLTNFHRFDNLNNFQIKNHLSITQPDYLVVINQDKSSLTAIYNLENHYYPVLFLDYLTVYQKN